MEVDELEGVFCSRREVVGFLEGLPATDSSEELLRDRRALDSPRGFQLSAESGISLGANSCWLDTEELVLKLGKTGRFHLSVFIVGSVVSREYGPRRWGRSGRRGMCDGDKPLRWQKMGRGF